MVIMGQGPGDKVRGSIKKTIRFTCRDIALLCAINQAKKTLAPAVSRMPKDYVKLAKENAYNISDKFIKTLSI